MKKKIFQLLWISSVILLISSCQKGIDKPFVLSEESTSANNPNAQKGKKKVHVSNLDELYAAVNNSENAGTEVILAPGIYVLNSSYPNAGRLELQTDMALKGQNGDPDAVFIDQSSLPVTSLVLSVGGRTGGIRMGREQTLLNGCH